jgi:ABC-type uncharacterized transport system permease subunit
VRTACKGNIYMCLFKRKQHVARGMTMTMMIMMMLRMMKKQNTATHKQNTRIFIHLYSSELLSINITNVQFKITLNTTVQYALHTEQATAEATINNTLTSMLKYSL